jgi:putative FmdB family regulatory protein
MPIYEYECKACGSIEEVIQNFSDAPLENCKHCSGKLHKLVSQSTFHLKGTGWYVTDYANKKSTSDTPPSKSEKSSETPKKETTTSKKAKE